MPVNINRLPRQPQQGPAVPSPVPNSYEQMPMDLARIMHDPGPFYKPVPRFSMLGTFDRNYVGPNGPHPALSPAMGYPNNRPPGQGVDTNYGVLAPSLQAATPDDGVWPQLTTNPHAWADEPKMAIDIHDTGPMATPNPHAWANRPQIDPTTTGAVPTPRAAAAAPAAAAAAEESLADGFFRALIRGQSAEHGNRAVMPSGVHMSAANRGR